VGTWLDLSVSEASKFTRAFNAVASKVETVAGKPVTFLSCVGIVVVWAACGPLFHFSDVWQLFINTGTTIITFLMVFLIQNSQNRSGAAIQIKLDEIILASKAQNTFVGIELLTEEELADLRSKVESRAKEEGP
jgi:low affinity Fe/Cu permease